MSHCQILLLYWIPPAPQKVIILSTETDYIYFLGFCRHMSADLRNVIWLLLLGVRQMRTNKKLWQLVSCCKPVTREEGDHIWQSIGRTKHQNQNYHWYLSMRHLVCYHKWMINTYWWRNWNYDTADVMSNMPSVDHDVIKKWCSSNWSSLEYPGTIKSIQADMKVYDQVFLPLTRRY